MKMTALAGAVVGLPTLTKLIGQGQLVSLTETRELMGTLIHLTVVARGKAQGEEALARTFNEMERLVSIFDHRQPRSPVAVLNQDGQLRGTPPEMLALMSTAAEVGRLTGGAFDVTVKPVLDQHQAGAQIDADLMALVDYRNVATSGDSIRLGSAEMAVTLDGIAKGRVVDGGVTVLRQLGFDNVLVEAGGDLVASGHSAERQPWQVGIQHPRPEVLPGYLARCYLTDQAVATSGDYMNYFSEDRHRHHIIDPRAGISPPGLASVTVVAPNAATADAFSTAIMVLGDDAGLSLINRITGVEALIVTKDLTVRRTAGFPA